jgi:hypothetical protein
LLILTQFSDVGSFVPNAVEINFVVGEDLTIVQVKMDPDRPMMGLGTLYAQTNKLERTSPSVIYIGLLNALKSVLDGSSHYFGKPNTETVQWLHGAILAFVRRYVDAYEPVGFDVFVALSCLADLFDARVLPSWLTLIGIGHIVGTLRANSKPNTRQRWLQLQRVKCLWKVPQHILRSNAEVLGSSNTRSRYTLSQNMRTRFKEPSSSGALVSTNTDALNCLAARTALFFLCNEDSSANGYLPSYCPFSGAVPLINCLGLQAKNDYTIRYFIAVVKYPV